LLLGRPGPLEALAELRVFGLTAPRGEDGDDGRQDVGVHGGPVLAIARVDLSGARLDLRVVAEGADGTEEIAAELAVERALDLLDLPAEERDLLAQPLPHAGGQPAPQLVAERPVDVCEPRR